MEGALRVIEALPQFVRVLRRNSGAVVGIIA
jgi:hypothetical protein